MTHAMTPSTAKMTIEIYTVRPDGTVTAPRTTVIVPHEPDPRLVPFTTHWAPCACPRHRPAGTR
ncbi:hypothetical protein AB0D49_37305 [Streptomyces sp. NPDC048290]|uniref:hypothetical protein n=1 Tax=Streptomyces sp. NPDC048290 TaxID=3155811 RepID=UPI00343F7381